MGKLSAGQLRDVWLSHVDFKESPAFEPGAGNVTFKVVTDHDVHVTDGGATLALKLKIDWTTEVGEDPCDLELVATAIFEWTESMPEDFRESWTSFHGQYLMWPFMRNYVSMITGASSIPPVILPTIAVPRVETAPTTDEFEAQDQSHHGLF